jgi:ABC-type nitrate/sulfonate/bicarbonate transport system substrate-binding protein
MLLLAGCLPTFDAGRQPVAPTSPPAPLRLTIGWGVTPISAAPSSVLWLADDLGFYKREGLAPELLLIQGTPNLVAACVQARSTLAC